MLGAKRKEKEMEAAKSKVETILGEGTKIEGELYTKGSIRVEGEVKGNIQAEGDLFVGEKGVIKCEIKGRNVIVAGVIEGNITATQKIEIMSGGKLIGDIRTNILKIEEGAIFKGNSNTLEKKEVSAPVEANRVKKEIAASQND